MKNVNKIEHARRMKELVAKGYRPELANRLALAALEALDYARRWIKTYRKQGRSLKQEAVDCLLADLGRQSCGIYRMRVVEKELGLQCTQEPDEVETEDDPDEEME